MLVKIFNLYKEGNLSLALKFKINKWLDKRIAASDNKNLRTKPLHRFYIRNNAEAFEFLFRHSCMYSDSSQRTKKIILFGEPQNTKHAEVLSRLLKSGHKAELLSGKIPDVNNLSIRASEVACFVSCYFNESINQRICQALLNESELRNIPFEYLGDTREDFAFARKQDHQHSFDFVSPLFHGEIDYFKIYEESLLRFEKKCDIRDYMDLCQLIEHIHKSNIEGDVAEFGSYKGHSGYLISQLLKAHGSNKQLYMFDTFEKFPDEDMGVDSFWSDTHEVNYEEVKSKFKDNKKVTLVKGDFTKTLEASEIKKLALIYIDCDSYRATTYLMEKLFEDVLSERGLLVLEDYGHPALLGNRLAFHNFLDSKPKYFRFFSQFSGFQIVVK
ncbi:MAG TPA: TylF/MycF/NovP-related O-methyltransferase [Bacteroidia bacterium]|nr:TylF/MycF/NovP-related O-methyltransferase [Bacteroidia bacterium]